MRTTAPTFGYLLSKEWNGELPAWGIGKSPLWTMAATSPALILQNGGNGKLTGPTGESSHTLWKYAYEPFS